MDYVANIEYKQKNQKIPAMTPQCVHDYLIKIGSEWTGKGVVVELGSWLGATAVSLLEGLKKANYCRHIYCFDRWKASQQEVIKAKEQGVQLDVGQDLVNIFLENVKPVYKHFVLHKGNIKDTIKRYGGGEIEICLFDAPKTDPLFSQCIDVLSKYWIPGVTVLGLLDYYSYKKNKGMAGMKMLAPVNFIEQHKDSFEKIAEWPDKCSCVFFKYIKKC